MLHYNDVKYQKRFLYEDIAWQTLKVWTRPEHLRTAYLAAVVPLSSDSGVWRKSPESDQIKITTT